VLRVSTDARGRRPVDHPEVAYAVVWAENEGLPRAGSLALGSVSLTFAGPHGRELPFQDIVGMRIDRRANFRLAGRPTLVIESRAGDSFRIASLDSAGTLHELAEQLDSARSA
jgi:hypothetical protein